MKMFIRVSSVILAAGAVATALTLLIRKKSEKTKAYMQAVTGD